MNLFERRGGILQVLNRFHQQTDLEKIPRILQSIDVAGVDMGFGQEALDVIYGGAALVHAVEALLGQQLFVGKITQKVSLSAAQFDEFGLRSQDRPEMGETKPVPRGKTSLNLLVK